MQQQQQPPPPSRDQEEGIARRYTPSSAPGDLPPRARPTGWVNHGGDDRLVRQQSSEALEVLSSQFFSG